MRHAARLLALVVGCAGVLCACADPPAGQRIGATASSAPMSSAATTTGTEPRATRPPGSAASAPPQNTRPGVPGPTITARPARSTPRVDGLADEWVRHQEYAVATRVGGAPSTRLTSAWRLAWDTRALYLFADVTDPVVTQTHPLRPWLIGSGDSIGLELGRYTTNVRTDRLGSRDVRILIGPSESGATLRARATPDGAEFGRGTTWTTGAAVVRRTRSGYAVEAAIPWEALNVVSPKAGLRLSANLLLADAVPTGADRGSLRTLMSHNPQRVGAGIRSRFAWGVLTLGS